MEANKPTRTQRTEQEIIRLMEEFENSEGITVKEFAEMHDISTATFYNWQKLYRSRTGQASSFITLEIVPSEPHSEHTLFAEVNDIKIFQAVPASYLKEITL